MNPHSSSRSIRRRRRLTPDRLALLAGGVLAFLLLVFLGSRVRMHLIRDRGLGPVPYATPTPPP